MLRQIRRVGRDRIRLDVDVDSARFNITGVIDLSRKVAERAIMLAGNFCSDELDLRILRRDRILLSLCGGSRRRRLRRFTCNCPAFIGSRVRATGEKDQPRENCDNDT